MQPPDYETIRKLVSTKHRGLDKLWLEFQQIKRECKRVRVYMNSKQNNSTIKYCLTFEYEAEIARKHCYKALAKPGNYDPFMVNKITNQLEDIISKLRKLKDAAEEKGDLGYLEFKKAGAVSNSTPSSSYCTEEGV